MNFDLQQPIAAYFTADNRDSKAVCQCFTENAVVSRWGVFLCVLLRAFGAWTV